MYVQHPSDFTLTIAKSVHRPYNPYDAYYRKHPNSFRRGSDQSSVYKSQLLQSPCDMHKTFGVLVYSGNLLVRRLHESTCV